MRKDTQKSPAEAAARHAQNAQCAAGIAELLHSRVLPARTHNCLFEALGAILDDADVRDDPSVTQHTLAVALDKLYGVTTAPPTVTATSAAGAVASAGAPTPEQSAPGDLLARMQAWHPHTNSGPQLTPDAVAALCGEIAARFDDDELSFDLLRVLRGLYQLYEAGLQHDRVFHALEGALIFGQLRAYMHTAHAQFSLEEFSHLDPTAPRAQRVLRREFVDEPAAE